jgi:hypothetical protein
LGLFTMAMMLASAAPGTCATYEGQVINPVSVAEVFAMMPTIAPRAPYESSAEYANRLDTAASRVPVSSVVVNRPWGTRPPTFDADKSSIAIYAHTLGYGRLDFVEILQLGHGGNSDSFGGIGFEVTRSLGPKSEYEATNGFGTKVKVERTVEQIDAVWEGPVKLGETIFVGAKRTKPLATLTLSPSDAKSVIEQGGTALVIIPKPPFVQKGISTVLPTFGSPRELRKEVRVLWADVKCVLIYDGRKTVVATFEVK